MFVSDTMHLGHDMRTFWKGDSARSMREVSTTKSVALLSEGYECILVTSTARPIILRIYIYGATQLRITDRQLQYNSALCTMCPQINPYLTIRAQIQATKDAY